MNNIRDKRLMVFTSLLRTLNFVGHSRVEQCFGMFLKFEEQYPLIDGCVKTQDHRNMREFIENYNSGEIE